jgi:[ribosomal protein S5]-alanine N-acetyltransferase
VSGDILLETPRLRLSWWTDVAVDELMALHGDAEAMRFLDVEGRLYTREKAAQRLEDWQQERDEHGLGKLRLTLREGDIFVGRAGFSPHDGVAEIGYSLCREHWGKGYAKEIAQGLSDWFFASRPDDSFIGFAHVDNIPSRIVLERIGMTETHRAEIAGMPHQFYVKHRPRS